jgi:predicted nucleic acid-binding protein
MSSLLLDSGVWLAARDVDDPHHEAAVALIAGERRVAALDLTVYEVANVAIRSWRSLERARIVTALVRDACADAIARVDDLVEQTIELGALHGLTSYDAAYVAAAGQNSWTLVSTDMRDLVRPGLALAPDEAAGR